MRLVRALYDALHMKFWPRSWSGLRPWYLNQNPIDTFAIWWVAYRKIPRSYFTCSECKHYPQSGICGSCMREAIRLRPKTGGGLPS
jgi:hypothetical protein